MQLLKSVISQTYSNLEYIVVDGGSTDGTLELLKKYNSQISIIISEKDDGLYDAMNKGIALSTGEWICFMNCGDIFSSCNVLTFIFENNDWTKADIIYGDAIQIDGRRKKLIVAGYDLFQLNYHPIYRHNASFVRTQIHKHFFIRFEFAKENQLCLGFFTLFIIFIKQMLSL